MVIQGIIRPPPEIRAVADRTASYVAKNGRAFETRILNSPKGQTPKFAFLHESSPFHSYYQERVRFYENGGVDEKENEQKGAEDAAKKEEATKQLEAVAAVEAANLKTTRKAASAMDPIGKALLTQRTKIADLRRQTEDPPASGASDAADVDDEEANSIQPGTAAAIAVIPPPPPFQFLHIAAPATVTFIQLETIQLTAQFVALSKGTTNFLHEVTAREWNNPAFGFCQPRHGHFAYFSALVDAYSRILQNHGYATDDPLTLAEKQHQRQREEELRNMANNVPHCLDAVAYRVEYQRDQADRARGNDQNDQQPLVSPIDWHDFVVVETIDFAVDEIVTMLPPPPPPSASLYPEVTLSKPQAEDGMDESSDDDEEEDETIRVVPSYTPKVYATNSTNQMETVIDPISGKRVAIKDMPEHMRIQLLDPKWAEERKKFQDKQKESNLVSGDMVARNLERFAQARGDRFGKKEQDLLGQEEESRKRLEEANRIIREQGQNQSTVGPVLPGMRKEPPTGSGSEEPASKKPKIITYAPTVLQPPPVTVGSIPLTQPPSNIVSAEDTFAAAATGAQPMQTSQGLGQQPPANQELIPEAEFAASLGKQEITIQIRVPNDPSQMAWNFYGQILSMAVNVLSEVKTVKGDLSTSHLNGMPANKIQLKNPITGAFLKDNATLAALNIGPSTTLELVPRARGGKKK